MNIYKKEFAELTPWEVHEILKIRQDVFVVEQNCIYHDIDDIDYDSIHVFLRDWSENEESAEDSRSLERVNHQENVQKPDKIQAYLRLFYKDMNENPQEDTHPRTVQMGRILTVTRGVGYGEKILAEGIRIAREEMKADQIYIEAQTYAIGFYEKQGFEVSSEEFLEDGIPHVQMMSYFKK